MWAVCFQGIYVTRVSEGGPAEIAGLQIGDKIMQVTDIPKEENKTWVGEAEAFGSGAGVYPASWGTHPSHFGAYTSLAPRGSWLSCV